MHDVEWLKGKIDIRRINKAAGQYALIKRESERTRTRKGTRTRVRERKQDREGKRTRIKQRDKERAREIVGMLERLYETKIYWGKNLYSLDSYLKRLSMCKEDGKYTVKKVFVRCNRLCLI